MICTPEMNSAPSRRYKTASEIITRISDKALWIGSRAKINMTAPATARNASTKNRMNGRLIRASESKRMR